MVPINIQIVSAIGYTRVRISFWKANYIKPVNCYFGKIMRKMLLRFQRQTGKPCWWMVFRPGSISLSLPNIIRIDKNGNFRINRMLKKSIATLLAFALTNFRLLTLPTAPRCCARLTRILNSRNLVALSRK